jgi:arabinose-5-phosphate isomerase
MRSIIESIIEAEATAVRKIPVTEAYEVAVQIIVERVHLNRGKVVTSGMGKAGQIANNMATTLSSTGIPAVFLHPSEAQHGDLGIIQENDVIIAVSNSGKTREITELLDLKDNLYPSVPVIVITSDRESPLAQKAGCVLETGAPPEVCPLGLTPTTSTTVMTVMGDILVVLLMKQTGFNVSDYARRHHGGYLGTISRGMKH